MKQIKLFFYGCSPFIIGWAIICKIVKGEWFYNLNYLNTANIVYKPVTMSNTEWAYTQQFDSFWDVITRDFGLFFEKIGSNFVNYIINDLHILVPIYIGIAVAVGLVLFRNKLLLIGFTFYLTTTLIFYSERFALPLLVVFFWALSSVKVKFLPYILGGLLIISLCSSIDYLSKDIGSNNYLLYYKEISTNRVLTYEIVTGMKKDRESVASRKPHIAYMLRMDYEVIPFIKTHEELLKLKSKYLFVGQVEAMLMGKQFYNLLRPTNKEGLKVVAYTQNPPSVLYEKQ